MRRIWEGGIPWPGHSCAVELEVGVDMVVVSSTCTATTTAFAGGGDDCRGLPGTPRAMYQYLDDKPSSHQRLFSMHLVASVPVPE